MNDNDLHETSMTPDKTTRSRGRPAYAEKAPRELRDDFALEIMKGVLASGVDVVDPAFPNPLDTGHKKPKFNPANHEESPL